MTHMDSTPSSTQTTALKRKGSLLAAVLAVPFLAALPARIARAQFPANNGNGHALDANNQAGSGGYNNTTHTGATVTQNDVIYNNVTGLRGFQGALRSTDPTAFRGTTFLGSADRFIGQSNGAAVRGSPSANATSYSATPYYSDARGVAPPSGYAQGVGGGGYFPENSSQAGQYPNQLQDQAANGVFRTGAGYPDANLNPIDPLNGTYTPYGTDIRLGPLDPANQQSFLLVSPLSGIQQGQLNNGADSYFLSRTELRRLQGGDRFQRIDDQTLQQMRREVQEEQQAQPQNPNELNQSVQPPLEAPINKPLDASIGSTLSVPQSSLKSGVATQEGMYRILNSAAAQETPVLKELDQRLEAYKQHAPLAMEQEQAYEKAVADKAKASKPAQPGTLTPIVPGAPSRLTPGTPAGGGPSVGLTPGRSKPDLGALASGTKTEPVHVTSLATGVKAKGLAGLLQSAEALMKQGKFTSAIDQYSLAQQVAPNNPLILLGQANAYLGSASYRDADQVLREAFAGDEALLHAQFDLNAVMGPQRVRTLTDDLKDLAAKDPKSELPVFLLAYMNYNTGHEAEAMKYLSDVEKREGHPDAVVARMLKHWYVPPTDVKPAAPELNK
jgi:tetratricopeptide (TPR) repeat protein